MNNLNHRVHKQQSDKFQRTGEFKQTINKVGKKMISEIII